MKKIIGFVLLSLVTSSVWADKGWSTVASLNAKAETQAVKVNQVVSKVAISCTEGAIAIQSVTVEADGKQTPFASVSKIKAGETQQISVGDKTNCDRLLLRVEGQGRFDVKVRK